MTKVARPTSLPVLASILILLIFSAARAQTAVFYAVKDNATQFNVYRYRVGAATNAVIEATLTDNSLVYPLGLTLSPSGELFVVNQGTSGGGFISRFLDPSGTPTFNGNIPSGPDATFYATFRGSELFVVGQFTGVKRFVIAPNGTAIPNGQIPLVPTIGALRGIVMTPWGELFVIEESGASIPSIVHRFTFDLSGNALPNGSFSDPHMLSSHGIAFSPWGELFVTNPGNNSIVVFAFDAAKNATYNGSVTGGGMDNPLDLAFAPWGELFVGNTMSLPTPNQIGSYAGISRFTFDAAHVASAHGVVITPFPVDGIAFDPSPTSLCSLAVTSISDSGPGSLRDALSCANSKPGLDTITFNIPASGLQTISLTSSLPTITDPVFIDGYSQPGTQQNTITNGGNAVLLIEIDGSHAGAADGFTVVGAPSLTSPIGGSGSTIRGLVINHFASDSSGFGGNGILLDGASSVVIAGNFIGTNSGGTAVSSNSGAGVWAKNGSNSNVIGGLGVNERNVISGDSLKILIDSSNNNAVLGNFIGTDITGTVALGNLVSGTGGGVTIFNSSDNIIGGAAAGARNVISGNSANALTISGPNATGNKIQGNFVGTDVNGITALPNGVGIVITSFASNTIVGGAAAGSANVISGNDGPGVDLINGSHDSVVQGNFIGTTVDGSTLLGNTLGMLISGSSNSTIGGTTPGAGNVIAGNSLRGITIGGGSNIAIRQNSIFSNTGLGISLGGMIPNDACDTDDGPNNLQNFPELTTVSRSGGTTTIQGTLNSTPNVNFTIEFFSNAAGSSSPVEGEQFIGSVQVITDSNCNGTFTAILPVAVPANRVITATATDPNGNTSEFSLPTDSSPPVSAVQLSSTPNAAGWNNADVNVSLLATDNIGGSGVKEIVYSASGSQVVGTTTVAGSSTALNVTAEGETTITYFARDNAGNEETPKTLIVRLDKSVPNLSCGSADGSWHANDVSITCNASDTVSGLANTADGHFDLNTTVPASSENPNASTDSRIVCDTAGNCATAGPINGNRIDKKAPAITVSAPTAGNYLLHQVVTVQFTCSDAGSGVTGCNGTSANGGPLDTSSTGAKSLTVTATDNAGNSATPVVVNYTVGYNVAVLYDQTKAARSGSTVPIKIRLVDATGANMSSPTTMVHAVGVLQITNQSSSTLDDAGNANPDFDFRYDASLQGYIFNLKTTGYVTGSYLLNFVVGSGPPVYSVGFQVRQ